MRLPDQAGCARRDRGPNGVVVVPALEEQDEPARLAGHAHETPGQVREVA